MRIEYDGVTYEFELEDVTFEESWIIHDETGMTLGDFIGSLRAWDGNAKMLQSLLWLGKRHAGEACRFKDLKSMSPFKLRLLPIEADATDEPQADEQAGAKAEKSADPTSRGGKTRRARTTATS